MTIKTYLKTRDEFYRQYHYISMRYINRGSIPFSEFKIRNLDEFIFLYSFDNPSCYYSNAISSIVPKKYKTLRGVPVTGIKIFRVRSMFDKYPEDFKSVQEGYKKQNKQQ